MTLPRPAAAPMTYTRPRSTSSSEYTSSTSGSPNPRLKNVGTVTLRSSLSDHQMKSANTPGRRRSRIPWVDGPFNQQGKGRFLMPGSFDENDEDLPPSHTQADGPNSPLTQATPQPQQITVPASTSDSAQPIIQVPQGPPGQSYTITVDVHHKKRDQPPNTAALPSSPTPAVPQNTPVVPSTPVSPSSTIAAAPAAQPLSTAVEPLRSTQPNLGQSTTRPSNAYPEMQEQLMGDDSPTQPRLRSTGDLPERPSEPPTAHRGFHPIDGSIRGLESLMQDAIALAKTAAENSHPEEVPRILREAQLALERATHMPSKNRAQSVPLVSGALGHSPSRSEDGSTYSVSSSISPRPLPGPRVWWAPKSNEPVTRDWAYRPNHVFPSTPETELRRRSQHLPPHEGESPRSEGVEDAFGPSSHVHLPSSAPDNAYNWGRDKFDEQDYLSADALKGKNHVILGENQKWSIHHHRRQPIARNWELWRKRLSAGVVCINTALIGLIIGIYAGEVPGIQYALTDIDHWVILDVSLYLGMAVTTFLFWPLPLLHGRKPYTLTALAIAVPLQFPQAVIVSAQRDPREAGWRTGLLVSRAALGLALGFAHINTKSTLLDLFGASLQSSHPHGEIVVVDDIRRHGGGMGLWLGLWSFCFIGSISLGFMIGADVLSGTYVYWGFYICVILIASVLLLDVVSPETRRSPHRRTMQEVELPNMNTERRVARGEVKMHVTGEGPKHWWEEAAAGIQLSFKMLDQPGFGLMALYLGWIYGQVVLVIVLLGNLLSVSYLWQPEYVGLGVLALSVGAFLAIPNTKANLFSRARTNPARTDSMTFAPRVTWTSHMVRRTAFMVMLPLAGIAYTLTSAGPGINYMVPIVFVAVIGYFSNLAISECHGLIMETFDTSDLQPGVNSRHRLQSLAPNVSRRRTVYSCYPRVTAGIYVSHSIGFLLAAAGTGIGGAVVRGVGAQKATGITAGILFCLTILLTMALWRYKSMQVIPNTLFGAANDKRDSMASTKSDVSWRAVIIGNPSGKIRRMNLLELGGLSRWTEIRRLNRLLNRTTTQALNPGWR